MIFFDADVDIEVKAKMEDVRVLRIPDEDPFLFFKTYSPDTEEYIMFSCEDGKVIIAIPKDS
jgi:hypothetical protein